MSSYEDSDIIHLIDWSVTHLDGGQGSNDTLVINAKKDDVTVRSTDEADVWQLEHIHFTSENGSKPFVERFDIFEFSDAKLTASELALELAPPVAQVEAPVTVIEESSIFDSSLFWFGAFL